jgi:predicted ATPase
MTTLIETLRLDGLLSFPPDSPPITLGSLNVLIGPNGSGKSNLIEALELLHAAPTVLLASVIRDGGGIGEWLWKGNGNQPATIDVRLVGGPSGRPLRYCLSLGAVGGRVEVVDERVEEAEQDGGERSDLPFFYRFQNGSPALTIRDSAEGLVRRPLKRESLVADESVLSQRKDPELYPELAWCFRQFSGIQTFREWSIGRYATLRQPQPADFPNNVLLPDLRNLGLILNRLDHTDAGPEFNRLMKRFLPRYTRVSTLVQGGTVQFFLHEEGLRSPIPATRLSDGTIRFMAILALLLMPEPPPLICLDEPELGLHPDAVSLLGELLVAAKERTQLIVTTHSDALVSALSGEPGSVLVCEHRGGTVLSRVEPEKLRHWLDKYSLGDLWRMGELGGNP